MMTTARRVASMDETCIVQLLLINKVHENPDFLLEFQSDSQWWAMSQLVGVVERNHEYCRVSGCVKRDIRGNIFYWNYWLSEAIFVKPLTRAWQEVKLGNIKICQNWKINDSLACTDTILANQTNPSENLLLFNILLVLCSLFTVELYKKLRFAFLWLDDLVKTLERPIKW